MQEIQYGSKWNTYFRNVMIGVNAHGYFGLVILKWHTHKRSICNNIEPVLLFSFQGLLIMNYFLTFNVINELSEKFI